MVATDSGEKPGIPGLSEDGKVEALLQVLSTIADGVSATLGEWCEVVIHDLRDLDSSIVHISGNVTGRNVGGQVPVFGLANILSGRTEPYINYTAYTDDGKTLKSSSILVHDESGKPVAAFCINVNVTPLLLFQRFLRMLPAGQEEPEGGESFSPDLGQMVETMIADCAYEVGKPVSLMSKSDRVEVVKALGEKGVFQLRKSVPLVAERLGVTEKTVYNYLTELQGEGNQVAAAAQSGLGQSRSLSPLERSSPGLGRNRRTK
jgi:predicted transcriptional regulator YheO